VEIATEKLRALLWRDGALAGRASGGYCEPGLKQS